MPRTARPCTQPGCPHLTRHRSGLCDQHLAAQRAAVDANRPTAHRRGYDQAHRADTARAKARGQRCEEPGCRRTDIHRDHHDGNPHNNHPSNIVWLCASHHSRKTLTNDVDRDTNGRILPATRRARADITTRRATIRSVDL